ncbi:hypothetical protein CZ771_02715 [Actinomycetales bacterium JB111]|nr:hypothetical protein CZ771_02715 [Actinomycetales bacterium JB111]
MTGDPAPNPTTPSPTPRTPVDPDLVARRYGRATGRSAGRSRRAQWIVPLVGAIVIALIAAGVNALLTRGPSVSSEHVGYTVVDETSVEVRFVVIADVGTEVVCTLRAVNTEFTEVGARDVRIGPVTENRTSVTESITTTELAASGHADRCRAVDP